MKRNLLYSFIAMLVASILSLGIVVLDASAQMTLTEIQAAIKAKGASWVAGENPISRLTLQEKTNLLGLLPDPGQTTRPPTRQLSTVGLPPSIDWRNNGGNYVSSVKSQGACSACWAYASTAAAESAVMIANKTPNVNLDLMEAVLISCCTNCSSGYCHAGYLGASADYLQTHGEPLQSCPATSCGYTCPNDTIKSWEWITPSVDNLRAALANYGPVVAGMQVYSDFYNYMSGVYSYTAGNYLGGHAVTVIGYNDAGQYFIGKNSWDTDWGEAGFFRIAYSEVGGTSQFGQQIVAYHGGDPNPPPPTCSYPISDYFTASGGTGSIQVATEAGCAWSATSNATWITINSGSSGSGPGAVGFTVSANTSSSARTGTMTVPGGTYTVLQQSGSSQCTYSLSPTSKSFTNAGGSDSINVTAGSGCSWTASANVSWITIGSGGGAGNGTVSYSVSANTGTSSRSGTITIADKSFTVSQDGTSCSFNINSTSKTFTADVGTGTVSVTAASGCAWTATSNASWISVTSGASGSGNGTVGYSVAANTTTSSRTGTITIAGQTFTVNQAAMVCSYTITPASNSFTSAAGTGTVSVTSATGCAWTATSNASWLTISSVSSVSGNGTVSYSVAANTSTSSRSGTLTIAGQTFTVNQAAMVCSYTITPASNSFTSAAGTGSVNVTSGSGCAWTASSSASWVTISSGSSGSGNGTVNYSVAANATTSSRTGTMTVAGQTYTVNQQAGASPTCSVSFTIGGFNLPAAGREAPIPVYAASDCSWSASTNVSWITFTSGATGKGNATLYFAAAANPGAARTGTITINGSILTVNQAGGGSCTYTLSPTSNSFTSAAGTGTVSVTTTSGCAWSATSNASWIAISSGASGSGPGPVSYSVAANTTTTSRSGTLTIAGQTFTVTQAAATTCTYALNPTSNSMSAAAGTGTVSVTSTSGCAWTATSNATSWLTITSGASGNGNGTVGYAVTANSSTTGRTGTLTVGGQTFTVSQQAASTTCSYTISPTSNSMSAAAGTGTVSVTSTSGCAWTAVSNASWISVSSGSNGSGTGSVSYTVAANTSTTPRTGTLTVAGKTVTISQLGVPTCSVYTTAGGFNVAYTGRQLLFPVYADGTCSWSATTNVPWITFVSGTPGSGNGTVTFTVAANTGAARTGTISINGTSLFVNQTGQVAISVGPTSLDFGTINRGTSSARTVNVTNSGTGDLNVTSISIDTMSGTVTSFSQSNSCNTVKPGGSCTVNLKFSPGGTGRQSTYLYIYSNGGSTKVPLTGTGR
jgi:hypothetical protein